MTRFILHLTDHQIEWLRMHSKRAGVPLAEIIRRALNSHIEREDRRWEAMEEAERSGAG